MRRSKSLTIWILTAIAIVIAVSYYRDESYRQASTSSLVGQDELGDGKWMTVYNDQGQIILETGHVVTVGDLFISEDNKQYEIYKVEQDRAYGRQVGNVDLSTTQEQGWLANLSTWAKALYAQVTGTNPNKVAIYHTHSDESYVPTDGKASKPAHGGVYQVGRTFVDAMRGKGINAIQDTTPHDPHDAQAYQRSRRTAQRLLAQKPTALFDVHRDSAPPGAYERNIQGKKTTQVMIVVGRQNPRMQSNLTFAKRLKAEVDKTHPGLIRGIFMAKGGYNQDLYDRALLLEVGSENNPKPDAQEGVALLADAIPKAIGTVPGSGRGIDQRSTGGFSTTGWIIGLVILGATIFVFVSMGGWKEARSKLSKWGKNELSNYLGGYDRSSSDRARIASSPEQDKGGDHDQT